MCVWAKCVVGVGVQSHRVRKTDFESMLFQTDDIKSKEHLNTCVCERNKTR